MSSGQSWNNLSKIMTSVGPRSRGCHLWASLREALAAGCQQALGLPGCTPREGSVAPVLSVP